MKVVALVPVGNEVEVVEHQLRYHLALGFDGIVVADLASVDGTSERLAAWRDDPRLVIRHFAPADLPQGMNSPVIGEWLVQAAKAHFAPDWMVRLDADEFLVPRGGDLRAVLARHADDPAIEIERRNIIRAAGTQQPPIPETLAALAGFEIVTRPHPTNQIANAADDAPPLILTRVGAKGAAQSGDVATFTLGGHKAVRADGVPHDVRIADDLLMVHFWFTTLSRFAQKSRYLREFEQTVRATLPAGVAWQWGHWAGVAESGTDAVAAEYARQFPDNDMLAALRAEGRVGTVDSYWAG